MLVGLLCFHIFLVCRELSLAHCPIGLFEMGDALQWFDNGVLCEGVTQMIDAIIIYTINNHEL